MAMKWAAVAVILCTATGVYWFEQHKESARYSSEFEAFVEKYGKVYSGQEEFDRRFARFQEVVEEIRVHNEAHSDFKLALNEFADMTVEEFKANYLKGQTPLQQNPGRYLPTEDLPLSVNWVQAGGVSPVQNQVSCGACWAFAATGAIEGLAFTANKTLLTLSPQQLIDCSQKFGNSGCYDGTVEGAYSYVMAAGGLETLKNYPLRYFMGMCWADKTRFVVSISNFTYAPSNDEMQLKAAVSRQPVAVKVQATQSRFMYYHNGVINAGCGTTPDHNVLVVGYGNENGLDYWLIKNSFGTTWGEDGFGKILRQDANNESPGMCGIALSPSYPL